MTDAEKWTLSLSRCSDQRPLPARNFPPIGSRPFLNDGIRWPDLPPARIVIVFDSLPGPDRPALVPLLTWVAELVGRGHDLSLVVVGLDDSARFALDASQVSVPIVSLDAAQTSGLWACADCMVATDTTSALLISQGAGQDGRARFYLATNLDQTIAVRPRTLGLRPLVLDPEAAEWLAIADAGYPGYQSYEITLLDGADRLEATLGLPPRGPDWKDGQFSPGDGRVSIIIPTRSRPGTIGRALRSLQAQSWAAWRAIVVLNGREAPAAYRDALEPFREDNRITVVERPDLAGIPQSQNAGLFHAEAETEFAAVLDDDDEYLPTFLDRLVGTLVGDRSLGMTYANVRHLYGGRETHREESNPPSQANFATLLTRNWIGHSQVVFRRSLLTCSGGFDERQAGCSDWDAWLRLASISGVRHVNETLAVHHWQGDNASGDAAGMRSAADRLYLRRGHGHYRRVPTAECYGGRPSSSVNGNGQAAQTMPAAGSTLPFDLLDARRLIAPAQTRDVLGSDPWRGRTTEKPWTAGVTVTLAHLNTPDLLEVVVPLLRLQTVRPYVLIVDTGSDFALLPRIEAMRGEGVEIHYIRSHGYDHASEPVAVACDLALDLCRTEFLFLTHVDCFPVARDLIERFKAQCSADNPVVGYQLTDRSKHTAEWAWMVSHTTTMLHVLTMHRLGLRFGFQWGRNLGVMPDAETYRDTETYFNWACRRAGIVPTLVGHEVNHARNRNADFDHVRSYATNAIYSAGGKLPQNQADMTAALSDARQRLDEWRNPHRALLAKIHACEHRGERITGGCQCTYRCRAGKGEFVAGEASVNTCIKCIDEGGP